MRRVYMISATGFTSVEKTAPSLRDALQMVHPNVRKAFERAQVWHNGGWIWCGEVAS